MGISGEESEEKSLAFLMQQGMVIILNILLM